MRIASGGVAVAAATALLVLCPGCGSGGGGDAVAGSSDVGGSDGAGAGAGAGAETMGGPGDGAPADDAVAGSSDGDAAAGAQDDGGPAPRDGASGTLEVPNIGGKPQSSVGRTGWTCTTDGDCLDDPEHLCIFGFCAERCRQGDIRTASSCQVVAQDSEFGDLWTCPSDLSVCMPGPVQDKLIICSNQAWCDALGFDPGLDMRCGELIYTGDTLVDGVCIPARAGAAEGQPCAANEDCSSRACLGASAGVSGICSAHCVTNADCAAGALCAGVGFQVDDTTTESTAWAGLCIRPGGSLDGCWAQEVCPADEVCDRFIEPTKLSTTYRCVQGNVGGAAAGEPCTAGAECLAGTCLWGQLATLGLEGYCTWPCPGGDKDCPSGLRCGLQRLHNNGTPGDLSDDPQYKVCVAGEPGDACELAAKKWCAPGSQCLHTHAEWPDTFGVCTLDDPGRGGR